MQQLHRNKFIIPQHQPSCNNVFCNFFCRVSLICNATKGDNLSTHTEGALRARALQTAQNFLLLFSFTLAAVRKGIDEVQI